MSYLAPTLQAFFTERLVQERWASACTIGAYRDTFRLLIAFAFERTGKAPSRLDFADLDAPLIGAFLEHLERDRQNSIRTRNVPTRRHPQLLPLRSLQAPRARERHP